MDVDGDGADDVMVLTGGFAPVPFNDVWVTEGAFNPATNDVCSPEAGGPTECRMHWSLVGEAPWSVRGWHTANVFGGRLYVIGGTPLNNDVFSANFTKQS